MYSASSVSTQTLTPTVKLYIFQARTSKTYSANGTEHETQSTARSVVGGLNSASKTLKQSLAVLCVQRMAKPTSQIDMICQVFTCLDMFSPLSIQWLSTPYQQTQYHSNLGVESQRRPGRWYETQSVAWSMPRQSFGVAKCSMFWLIACPNKSNTMRSLILLNIMNIVTAHNYVSIVWHGPNWIWKSRWMGKTWED